MLLIASNANSHAGKLFEYLATGKPIIALSPPQGEIAKLLRETNAGWCVDPWDKEAVGALLAECFRRVKAGGPSITPDWNAIQRYSWPNIMARFAAAVSLA